MNIELELITNENVDYDLLHDWCSKEFVYEWFEQRILSKEEIYTKYSNKINNSNQVLFYIKADNNLIGLVQYYKSDYEVKEFNNLYEYDLFIGEEFYLDKGLGKIVISMVNNILFNEKHADGIILRPFTRNIRACKCYEKCGFELINEYDGVDTLNRPEKYSVYLIRML